MLHDWRIEPREHARHEQRRGRRHAFAHLEPARTALVVVDMVPFFLDENPYARGIVPHVNALAGALRAAGGTVAWVVPRPEAPSPARIEHLGPRVAAFYARSGGDGPPHRRLSQELDVAPDDLVEEKAAASAFFPGRCELQARLEDRGIDTVVVAGTVANVCCESTARDAATLGHRVIMVADANAAVRDQDLNATLHTIYRSFGDVRPTSEVLALIGRAGRPDAGARDDAAVPAGDAAEES